MKVTIDWLKNYVDFQSTPEKLSHNLTMIGLEVDSIKQLSYDFDNVVIGQIVELRPHEKVRNLSICDVNIGSQVISLLCGAPNVAKNLKVAVALEGARLPNGKIIKHATIHGYDSPGMICSEEELGLSHRSDIIMELEPDSPIGKNLKEYLSDREVVIEIDLTPNRPDCLGIIGVAREIAATNGCKLKKPEVNTPEFEDKRVEDFIQVVIENPENCPRYSARYIKGVKIGSSPQWLVQKLEAVGIRSINNVVDITNFVMMETGQPLHAFDYDLIEEGKIVVKNARKSQYFTTLDDIQYTLTNENLMICDARKPVALAGIMGGLNSEIRKNTTKILLESAYFDPLNIRRSSKYLGISTDSSQRFERGVDPNGTIYALNRATQLICEIAGGKAAKGYVDNYEKPISPIKIPLRLEKVKRILGDKLSKEKINNILNSLEFNTRVDSESIEVDVPTFRPDITREEDLIEEIARIYGYNNIEEKVYSKIYSLTPQNQLENFTNLVRDISITLGYNEILTNTFINPSLTMDFSKYQPIIIKNPLSEDLSVLRTSLVPCLLFIIKRNLNRRIQNLRFFEVGNIFYWVENNKVHDERKKIILGLTGSYKDENWLEKPRAVGFFDLKGDIVTFLNRLNLKNYQFVDSKISFLDHRSSEIECRGKNIGFLGALKKNILTKFDIDTDVFVAELDFNNIFELHHRENKFTPIPKFPYIKRDLSVLVDINLPVKMIFAEICKTESRILKSVNLFDLYTGKQIEAHRKSITFSLVFYSENRTLTEKEVDEDISNIIRTLEKNLNIQLRK